MGFLFFLRSSWEVVLFVEYSFDIVLEVLVLKISYALSLFALIQCIFESLHLVRIATNRATRSGSLSIVMM